MSDKKQITKYDAIKSKIAAKSDPSAEVLEAGEAATMQSLATIPEDEGGAAIAKFDPASMSALIEMGVIEAAPQLFTLEAGMMITGIVDSCGTTELLDENTKQPKTVRTWQLTLVNPETNAPGRKISILGAAQLDRQLEGGNKDLPKWIGRKVVIARGETKKMQGKAKQLTEYFVGAYKE